MLWSSEGRCLSFALIGIVALARYVAEKMSIAFTKTMFQANALSIPDEDLIETWILTRRIANSFHPVLREATGLRAVVGKLKQFNDAFSIRTDVTREDFDAFEPLLDCLPPIHGNMSDSERAGFDSAYAALPNRLNWTPIVADEWDRCP